jgi:hypothetical protein
MLAFQSGLSVAMTAEVPSGEIRASVMSVVFRNSSRVIAGALAGELAWTAWAGETGALRHRAADRETQRSLRRISAL